MAFTFACSPCHRFLFAHMKTFRQYLCFPFSAVESAPPAAPVTQAHSRVPAEGCPPITAASSAICVEECVSDVDCRGYGTSKCCYNGQVVGFNEKSVEFGTVELCGSYNLNCTDALDWIVSGERF